MNIIISHIKSMFISQITNAILETAMNIEFKKGRVD